MGAGLIGRADQQNDERDRALVEALKLDRLRGTTSGHDERLAAVTFAVRNSQAITDTGGALGLALQNGFERRIAIGEAPGWGEEIDEFGDRGAFFGCENGDTNALGCDDLRNQHSALNAL